MPSTRGASGQWYAHNGDFSGAVKASIPVRPQTRYPDPDHTTASTSHGVMGEDGVFVEVEIPFDDIRTLYLRHLRSRKIRELEQASDDELEGILGLVPAPAPKPVDTTPQWVDEAVHYQAAPFPGALTEATGDLTPGYTYVHVDGRVLARFEGFDGVSPLFSVFDTQQPYGWQEGAGLDTVEMFRTFYPYRWLGPAPLIRER